MPISDITNSDVFQYSYPLLNALLAASGPAGYRAAQAGNVGLGIVNHLDQQRQEDERRKLLDQKLGDFFAAKKQVTPQMPAPGQPQPTLAQAMPDSSDDSGMPAPAPAQAVSAPTPVEVP